ncbi:MAG TPA: universal stress protein, partial [Candidatus Baltobacteraceae bacterium]|nr:universal stress protein [Candidatus Baltobacteraceae bacterium]
MFKSILCPVDGSETAAEALEIASRLAAEQGARLTVCTVVNPAKASAMAFGDPAMSAACFSALDDEARAMVVETVEKIKNLVPAQSVCLSGETVPSIVHCAEEQHADLIVMGSHGRTGISRA